MKKQYLFLLLILFSCSISGKERLKEDVISIASRFLNDKTLVPTRSQNTVKVIATSDDVLPLRKKLNTKIQTPAFYILNGDKSYVIVSGDDIMPEILGYSDQGEFDLNNIPDNMSYWLSTYLDEYTYLKNNNVANNPTIQTVADNSYPSSVAPLLETMQWDQGNPYNKKCPQKSVTGCVATAMAMILKYHNYPEVGKGSKTYITEKLNVSLSYNFSEVTFDWDNMLPIYKTGQYNTAQADAVAELMYACGVAVSMNYSPSESGAYSFNVPNSLIDYFDCDPNIQHILRDYFDYKTWMGYIKEELSSNRPLYYSGQSTEGGHAFVFDGYDRNDLVHVNWGWSGVNNGYFLITALNPSSPGIGGGTSSGGGFVSRQAMVRGIQPPTPTTKYQSYFMIDNISFAKQPTKKGESFLPTLNGIFNMSSTFTNGQLGLVLERDGEMTVIDKIDFPTCKSHSGYESMSWSNFNSNFVFPHNIPDGVYSFYVASRVKNIDNEWSRALCLPYTNGIYKLIVQGDNISIEDYWGELEVTGSLEVQHNLYSTYTGDFILNCTNHNNSKPYSGNVAVGFYQGDKLISTVGVKEIYLEAGQTNVEIALSGKLTNVPAGNYTIYPIAKWGSENKIFGDPITVAVSSSVGLSDIKANSIDLSKNEYFVDEPISVLTEMAITSSGSANVYDKNIDIVIFDSNAAEVDRCQKGVFLERGNTYNFEFIINPSLKEGEYKLGLYKTSLIGSSLLLNQLPFKVIKGTGINDTSDDHLRVVLNQSTKQLYIESDLNLKGVVIYDTTGRIVLHHSFSNEYIVDLESLPKGIYLISIMSDNKNYMKKIMLQ